MACTICRDLSVKTWDQPLMRCIATLYCTKLHDTFHLIPSLCVLHICEKHFWHIFFVTMFHLLKYISKVLNHNLLVLIKLPIPPLKDFSSLTYLLWPASWSFNSCILGFLQPTTLVFQPSSSIFWPKYCKTNWGARKAKTFWKPKCPLEQASWFLKCFILNVGIILVKNHACRHIRKFTLGLLWIQEIIY